MNWAEKFLVAIPWITGGLAGAVFTLVARIISEKRRKKRILLHIEKTQYTLPPLAQLVDSAHHELKVAYNGIPYEHLFSYSIVAKNVGHGSVRPYSLVVVMPMEAKVLATFSRIEPVSHEIMAETKQVSSNLEYTFKLPKLEKGDTATISLLVDSSEPQIRCIPRDIDDVEIVVDSKREHLSNFLFNGITLIGFSIIFAKYTFDVIDYIPHGLSTKRIILLLPIGYLMIAMGYFMEFFNRWKRIRHRAYDA